MAYSLQMLRALIEAHPDRAGPLQRHVEALEASIDAQPEFCLQNVRTLFEAAHATIAPQLGVGFARGAGFPDRMRGVIAALDFTIADHPESDKINAAIAAMMQGIDDTAVALAQLSNIPNMRHGGSLDWGTLQRQHAIMLGGLCDTLVSFLFDVAWSRGQTAPTELIDALDQYEDFETFNLALDDLYDEVMIANVTFQPSRILYFLDRTQYDSARIEWEAEQAEPDAEAVAA